MQNRILFYLCLVFIAVNIVAFLVNLYVVLYDKPVALTYHSLYLTPAWIVMATVGALYFKRQD